MHLYKPIKVFKCNILHFNKDLNIYETLKMNWEWGGLWMSAENPSPDIGSLNLFILSA